MFLYVCDEPSTVILQLPWSLLRFRPRNGVHQLFDQLGERDRRFGELTTPWRHLGLLDAKILQDHDGSEWQFCLEGSVVTKKLVHVTTMSQQCIHWYPLVSIVGMSSIVIIIVIPCPAASTCCEVGPTMCLVEPTTAPLSAAPSRGPTAGGPCCRGPTNVGELILIYFIFLYILLFDYIML